MALEFSPEALNKFEDIVARYPKKEAAMLPVLYLAQEEFGYLSKTRLSTFAADGSIAGAGAWCRDVLHDAEYEARGPPSHSNLPDTFLRSCGR